MAALLIPAGLLIGTLVQAQDKPQGVRLTGAELAQLYEPALMVEGFFVPTSNSFSHVYLRGGIVHEVYADRRGSGGHIEGKWRLLNDTLCVKWLGMPQDEGCSQIYKIDDGSHQGWSGDGRLSMSFRTRRPQ
jgi:hypothetical protein